MTAKTENSKVELEKKHRLNTGTDVCDVAWFLIHGREGYDKDQSKLLSRTFQPGPRRTFDLGVTDDGENFVYTHDGGSGPTRICGEFWIPALLPDAFVLSVIHTEPKGRRSEIFTWTLGHSRIDERLIALLRGAGCWVGDEAKTIGLVKEITSGCRRI